MLDNGNNRNTTDYGREVIVEEMEDITHGKAIVLPVTRGNYTIGYLLVVVEEKENLRATHHSLTFYGSRLPAHHPAS